MIIAKGSSRKVRVWKNIDVSWEKLESIFNKIIRTGETVEEYKALPKEIQDNIKDVWGFVGAYINDSTNEIILPKNKFLMDDEGSKEDTTQSKVVVCKYCGAQNKSTKNEAECEYCGSPLE